MLIRFIKRLMPRFLKKWLKTKLLANIRLDEHLPSGMPAGQKVLDHYLTKKARSKFFVEKNDEGFRVVRVAAHMTAAKALSDNRQLLTEMLEAAGVDYEVVKIGVDRLAVAVDEADMADVLQALRQRLRNKGVYAEAVQSGEGAPALAEHLPESRRCTPVVAIYRIYGQPGSSTRFGKYYACQLLFSSRDGETVSYPRNTTVGTVVGGSDTTRVDVAENGRTVGMPEIFTIPSVRQVEFPIDVVYTWVDGSDPEWRRKKEAAEAEREGRAPLELATSRQRFENRDELRYSIRSVHMFAPFVRNIYIVTDGQVPSWLDEGQEGVHVVDHKDIFPPEALPCFNSHAIEARLHHIPGLSEHFLYLNDDVFFGAEVFPTDFFHPNGISKVFLSKATIARHLPAERARASDWGGRNAQELILREFGKLFVNKSRHTAHVLRRSVMGEIEERFPDEMARTVANTFRDETDLAPTSILYPNYALVTARAVIDSIAYGYVDLSAPDLERRLAGLARGAARKVFCLNDTDAHPEDWDEQTRLVKAFMEAYYPYPSPCEKTE